MIAVTIALSFFSPKLILSNVSAAPATLDLEESFSASAFLALNEATLFAIDAATIAPSESAMRDVS